MLELLASLALQTTFELRGFPVTALRALLNFHRTEFLDNLQKANLYTRRAKHSQSLAEVAYRTLQARIEEVGSSDDTEAERLMAQEAPLLGDSDVNMSDLAPPSA